MLFHDVRERLDVRCEGIMTQLESPALMSSSSAADIKRRNKYERTDLIF